MTKKHEDYISPAARNAAHRHEEQTGHATMGLYDDDGNMEGMCCANQRCDWMRYNVQPRRPKPDMPRSKTKLQLIARLFAANVVQTSQPSYSLGESGLTEDEADYVEQAVFAIAHRMLGEYRPSGNPADIVNQVA